MAKCNLLIELEEPHKTYRPTDRVRGVVIVNADADVNCKGLDISSGWSTHGRGNIDSHTVETKTVFQGQWRAGAEQRYEFDLPIADWPPSYSGNYLNIDHSISAVARIPWAFDPKTSRPYHVHCRVAPESGVPQITPTKAGPIGTIIGSGFALIFVAVFIFNPFIWIVAIPILMAAGVWWFFKKYLPKKLLGDVRYTIDADTCHPGQNLSATLVVHPTKDIQINGIKWTVTGEEKCVSGSGSNRRTHRHEFFRGGDANSDLTILPGNEATTVPLQLKLPDDPCYTLDLGDNEIVWNTNVRIDIPRWPDWVTSVPLQVVPSANDAVDTDLATSIDESPSVSSDDSSTMSVTFESTVQMIDSVRGQPDQIDRLVEAVHGLPMQINVTPERRELYGGDASQYAYEDGHVVIGHVDDPPLAVSLFIPRTMADEFEQATDRPWRGSGSIVGYDHRQHRLQIRVEV